MPELRYGQAGAYFSQCLPPRVQPDHDFQYLAVQYPARLIIPQ